MALPDRPDARWSDRSADGGELALDAALAPVVILLRQPNDECRSSLRDARSTGPAVWAGTALGDEVPVPSQEGCRLDEQPPEMLTRKQSCESRQHGPIRLLQRRSMDLGAEDRHFIEA
jgi:hypothetical protein